MRTARAREPIRPPDARSAAERRRAATACATPSSGATIYLGHLDLIRHLPRIFRRAGLRAVTTPRGFHPKPELSFGPALGLGIPSLGEVLDVKLSEDVDADTLLRRLQAVTLGGIRFTGAVRLRDDDRALGRVLTAANFAALLPAGAGEAWVAQALARFAGGQPLPVLRPGSGDPKKVTLGRTVEVRRSLLAVDRPSPAVLADLQRDLPVTGPVLTFSVAISHEGSARPVEVLEALAGPEAADAASFVRVSLSAHGPGEAGVDPLDLPALRARTPRGRQDGGKCGKAAQRSAIEPADHSG